MSQKSLPVLNKVNTSMIWYSTYYCKHYSWLSSQYLYLLYFLNKLFVYLDFIYSSLRWFQVSKLYFYPVKQHTIKTKYTKTRFFYPVTSYLVSMAACNIFFNLYYKTSLEKFQDLTPKPHKKTHHFKSHIVKGVLPKIFYK